VFLQCLSGLFQGAGVLRVLHRERVLRHFPDIEGTGEQLHHSPRLCTGNLFRGHVLYSLFSGGVFALHHHRGTGWPER
jgi:hypothetical protein